MNSVQKTFRLARLAVRHFSNGAVQRQAVTEVPSSKFASLKEKQKRFQIDDNLPVHLKSGLGDKFLYRGTLFLMAVCLGMSGEVLYKLTFPPQQD